MSEAILVAGLGFGDECKGATVDYLVRKHKTPVVVRYNGGPQAAHNVVTDAGQHHTFAQFGSGSFVPGVATYLSRFVTVNPLNLLLEAEHLAAEKVPSPLSLMFIDENALITTPYHVATNRLREWMRGSKRHGSCGMGVGETLEDFRLCGDLAIFARDLSRPKILAKKLEALRQRKLLSLGSDVASVRPTPMGKYLKYLERADESLKLVGSYLDFVSKVAIVGVDKLAEYTTNGSAVFEGAQGVLLDRNYGFYPHITKSDTTFANAHRILEDISFHGSVRKVGVSRAYATRHGAGPFVTEDSEIRNKISEPHNTTGDWQGKFRMGYFDAVAVNYAIEAIGGVDEIALNCIDQVVQLPKLAICTAYEGEFEFKANGDLNARLVQTQKLFQTKPVYQIQGGTEQYLRKIIELLPAPIGLIGKGPKASDRTENTSLTDVL